MSSEVGRPKWVEQLRLLPQLVESLPPRLRHGRRVAPAHLIAAQYYCEVQVELELVAGEAVTPERGERRRDRRHKLENTVKLGGLCARDDRTYPA